MDAVCFCIGKLIAQAFHQFLYLNKPQSPMWILFALLAAVSAAVVTVLSKAGLKDVDSSVAFAIQAVLIILVSWGVVLVQGNAGQLKTIDGRTWTYLIIAGVVTTLSSLFTFKALKMGDASIVNPLERVSLVFAIILAAIFLKEKITWQIAIGAALMVVGALVIAFAKK
jgi:bacterial/archaeal transporter family protein